MHSFDDCRIRVSKFQFRIATRHPSSSTFYCSFLISKLSRFSLGPPCGLPYRLPYRLQLTTCATDMEINIQIKNVQKPEDVISAFAAVGQGQAFGQGQAGTSSSRHRPPIQRARREAMATTAATRRPPSLILSQRELDALHKVHPRGGKDVHSSTDAADDADRTVETASGVRPKMGPQPFSVFQRPARQHQGRTLSPRPYYQRGDQVGAADRATTLRPTRAGTPSPFQDLQQTRAPSRPLLVRKRSKSRQAQKHRETIHIKIPIEVEVTTQTAAGILQIPYTSDNIQISSTSGNIQISHTSGNVQISHTTGIIQISSLRVQRRMPD